MKQNTASSPHRLHTLSFEDEAITGVRKRPVPPTLRLDAVPRVAIDEAALRAQPLDHRAGFLLAQVDGVCNVDTLLDLSSMPREEALAILSNLAATGIITLASPHKSTPPPGSNGRIVWGWSNLE